MARGANPRFAVHPAKNFSSGHPFKNRACGQWPDASSGGRNKGIVAGASLCVCGWQCFNHVQAMSVILPAITHGTFIQSHTLATDLVLVQSSNRLRTKNQRSLRSVKNSFSYEVLLDLTHVLSGALLGRIYFI